MVRLALLIVASLAVAGCASQTPPPRDNLDPLFRGRAGTGQYPVDPADLERKAPTARARRNAPPEPPPPEPGKDAPLPCKHQWEFLDQQTHAYVNREGAPMLCTPRYCTQCGLLIHECGRGR
jgi:hypothetical protein